MTRGVQANTAMSRPHFTRLEVRLDIFTQGVSYFCIMLSIYVYITNRAEGAEMNGKAVATAMFLGSNLVLLLVHVIASVQEIWKMITTAATTVTTVATEFHESHVSRRNKTQQNEDVENKMMSDQCHDDVENKTVSDQCNNEIKEVFMCSP